MFKVNKIKNFENLLQEIELVNETQHTSAKINLNAGGSLQELIFNGITIISDLESSGYSDIYASAILFPFANRIKLGKYTFKEKQFNLEKNDGNNALHGLVYNKIFHFVESEESESYASVTIAYQEKDIVSGFPFKFSIFLTYTLTTEGINLKVDVKNEDNKAFPFNLGWHPYFFSSNLKESNLEMDSTTKLIFDLEMIATGVEDSVVKKPFSIGERYFDDCFKLNKSSIIFKTPVYFVKLSSDSEDNYLQIHTPNIKNILAIEPITGPANSFNNKIDLQILEPGKTYSVKWNIEIQAYD
ncbi:aldose 1-epimerase [Kaistella polysaccharea]|uniref:aldose 1-epimerase n=1 Tax=Kaistella polysaccharea TaxID=2878534 RepID=UPI001CF3EC75|nr:aldose 1-epimerase [Kaistella polysaccharea]WKF44011.1 galactose mutarotase [Kaistella polysaccharea]